MTDTFDRWDEQNCDPPYYDYKGEGEKEPTGMMPVRQKLRRGGQRYRPDTIATEPMPMNHQDFNDFVETNYQLLLGMVKGARGLQKVDAEDILHDTLERLSKRPEKIDKSKNPSEWIKRAIHWQITNFFEDEAKRVEVEGVSLDQLIAEEGERERSSDETEAGDPIIGHQKTPEAVIVPEHSTLEREVVEEFAKLDAYYQVEQYSLPYKLFLQDFTVAEIEEQCDLTTEEVRWRLKVVGKHLKDRFKDYRV